MALVHSRVDRVVYVHQNREFGGLGGVNAIHTIPSLNHHFRVLRINNVKMFEFDKE